MLQHTRFCPLSPGVAVRASRLAHCPRALPAPFGAELGLAPGGALASAGVAGGGLFHLIHQPVVRGEEGGGRIGSTLPIPLPNWLPGTDSNHRPSG
jgi:hypothetical protein